MPGYGFYMDFFGHNSSSSVSSECFLSFHMSNNIKNMMTTLKIQFKHDTPFIEKVTKLTFNENVLQKFSWYKKFYKKTMYKVLLIWFAKYSKKKPTTNNKTTLNRR